MQDKNTFHLLTLKNTPIYEQLKIEEALLRTDDRNFIIVNQGSTPAIIMGISGKPEKLVDMNRLQKKPIPLIKRFSGGGTVFVDESTYFLTFICNSETVKVPCFPCQVHCFVEKIYKQVFSNSNFRLVENDYVFGEKKFGGNAQYLKKGRWLHHSSLLWDFKEENMDYLLFPEKTPEYRKKRSHSEFLCKLSEIFPSIETMHETFHKAFEQHFVLKQIVLEDVKTELKRPHRKATITLF